MTQADRTWTLDRRVSQYRYVIALGLHARTAGTVTQC